MIFCSKLSLSSNPITNADQSIRKYILAKQILIGNEGVTPGVGTIRAPYPYPFMSLLMLSCSCMYLLYMHLHLLALVSIIWYFHSTDDQLALCMLYYVKVSLYILSDFLTVLIMWGFLQCTPIKLDYFLLGS